MWLRNRFLSCVCVHKELFLSLTSAHSAAAAPPPGACLKSCLGHVGVYETEEQYVLFTGLGKEGFKCHVSVLLSLCLVLFKIWTILRIIKITSFSRCDMKSTK